MVCWRRHQSLHALQSSRLQNVQVIIIIGFTFNLFYLSKYNLLFCILDHYHLFIWVIVVSKLGGLCAGLFLVRNPHGPLLLITVFPGVAVDLLLTAVLNWYVGVKWAKRELVGMDQKRSGSDSSSIRRCVCVWQQLFQLSPAPTDACFYISAHTAALHVSAQLW